MPKEDFIRYQSLYNRFILFDWRQKSPDFVKNMISDKNWPDTVRNLCLEHACSSQGNLDGGLVLTIESDQFHVKVFNSDGSDGQVCLNGARCVAHYLYKTNNFKEKLTIFMG